MSPLMPSLAKGGSIYRPGQGTHGATNATLALPDDSAMPDDNTLGIDHPSQRLEDDISSDRSNGGHVSDGDPSVPPPSSVYPP